MDDSAKIPSDDSKAQEDNVPLLFNMPVGISSRYAHHLLVQMGDNEVTLSFFEIIPPIVLDAKTLENGVRADCVARVTVARTRYPEFVKAMASVLQTPEVKGEAT